MPIRFPAKQKDRQASILVCNLGEALQNTLKNNCIIFKMIRTFQNDEPYISHEMNTIVQGGIKLANTR